MVVVLLIVAFHCFLMPLNHQLVWSDGFRNLVITFRVKFNARKLHSGHRSREVSRYVDLLLEFLREYTPAVYIPTTVRHVTALIDVYRCCLISDPFNTSSIQWGHVPGVLDAHLFFHSPCARVHVPPAVNSARLAD